MPEADRQAAVEGGDADVMSIEARVGQLEIEQAKQGERLVRMEGDMSKALSGIDILVARDAKRPDLQFAKVVSIGGATLALVYGLYSGGVWLVAHAPSMTHAEERIQALEWKQGWASRIEKGN